MRAEPPESTVYAHLGRRTLGIDHHIEMSILGPIQIWVDGEERAPSGRVRRSILGLLALRPDQVIAADILIDAVWDGSPPTTARASLQMHITQIRRSVAVDELIVTEGSGYRLALTEDDIDAHRFTHLTRMGLDHLREGRFRVAAETLKAAVELWFDPPLSDLSHLEAVHTETTELVALYQEARIAFVEASLEISGWAPDVGQLERLVEDFPMDERAWGLLAIGLYRSTGQADAIDALRRASNALAEELGIEPGPRLRRIEDQVFAQSPELSPPEPPRVDLPAFATRFLGRGDDVRRLSKAVLEQRLTTLVGTGGMGKTRLAVEVATQTASGFQGGVFYIGLQAIDDPKLIDTTITARVGGDRAPFSHSPDEVIGDRMILLILDNCEHVVDAVAETSRRLLSSCPELTILATSRVPLEVAGETIWVIRPLETVDTSSSTTDILESEAVGLFVDAARRVNPDFDLTGDRIREVAEICRDLAGMPLAIELAASQCDVLTLKDIQRRVSRFETKSGAGAEGALGDDIDQMVESSLDLLEGSHRRLFESMAVFSTPVDRETLSAVCDVEDGSELTNALKRLSHVSLLSVDVDDETAMFGQLPPLRQAAGRRLSTDVWEALRRAHANYFLALVEEAVAKSRTVEEKHWFRRLDGAMEEIRNALEYVRATDAARALDAAIALLPYWYARDHIVEGRHHIATALAGLDDASQQQRADALKAEGTLAHAMTDMETAERMLTEAADIYRGLDDLGSLARTLNNLGVVAVDAGRPLVARERYTEARGVFESMDHGPGLAATALNLGVVALQLEETESARAWFEIALAGWRELGDRSEEAHSMERLSHVAHFEGDIDRARSWLFPARRLYEDLGLADAVAGADRLFAELAVEEGNPDAASIYLERSIDAVIGLGHFPAWVPGLLEVAARVAALREDHRLAATLVGAASGFRLETRSSRPIMWNASHDMLVAELEVALGDRYPAVFAAGQSMNVSNALEMARQVSNEATLEMGIR